MAYASTITNAKRSYMQFDSSQVNSDGEFMMMVPNEDGVPFPNENLNLVVEDKPNIYDIKILNENQQIVKEFVFDNTEFNYTNEELSEVANSMALSTEQLKQERLELGRQEILRQQILQELNPDDLDTFVLTCNNGWTNPDGSPRQIHLSKNSELYELQEGKEIYEMTFDEVATLNSSGTENTLAEEHEDYFQNHWEYHGLTRPPEIIEGTPAPMVE